MNKRIVWLELKRVFIVTAYAFVSAYAALSCFLRTKRVRMIARLWAWECERRGVPTGEIVATLNVIAKYKGAK